MKARHPNAQIYAAEPKDFDDLGRSLKAGKRVRNEPGPNSICDALLSPTPGEITFPIHQKLLAGAFAVSDEQALDAMNLALRQMKLVIEPGGATSLAAVIAERKSFAGKNVVIVSSGGNADPEMIERALARPEISL